jgi:3-phosphoshikimate 1-carboxyvinyltransferase
MIIRGGKPLHGATVSSCNDHRIAMTAAVMSLLTDSAITIEQAESVNKSYPSFYQDYRRLGGQEEES